MSVLEARRRRRAPSPPRNGTTTPTPRSPAAKRYKSDGVGDGPAPPRAGRRRGRRGGRARAAGAGPPPLDRFIPNRTSMDFDEANHALSVGASPQRKGDDPAANARPVEVEFRRATWSARLAVVRRRSPELGGADSPEARLLRLEDFRFGAEVQNRPDRFRSALEVIADPRQSPATTRDGALARPVPTKPSRIRRILWMTTQSAELVVVQRAGVAREQRLPLERRDERLGIAQLEQGDCVTSVSWAPGGSHLCVGTDSAAVQLCPRAWLWSGRCGATGASGVWRGIPFSCGVPFFLCPSRRWRRCESTDAAPAPGRGY